MNREELRELIREELNEFRAATHEVATHEADYRKHYIGRLDKTLDLALRYTESAIDSFSDRKLKDGLKKIKKDIATAMMFTHTWK